MEAAKPGVCVGQVYFDVVNLLGKDGFRRGERNHPKKIVSGYGGNSVCAARTVASLGGTTKLVAPESNCALASGFRETLKVEHIDYIPCIVDGYSIPIATVLSEPDGERTIFGESEPPVCSTFPTMDPREYEFLHVDGYFGEKTVDCLRTFKAAGTLTSLDGGRYRPRVDEMLKFVDIAVVSDKFSPFEDRKLSETELLNYLQYECHCKIGGITRGERGLLWYDEGGCRKTMPSLNVTNIVDTTNAGDIFHGAYLRARQRNRWGRWEDHFTYARAASAHSIQHHGITASLPRHQDAVRAGERLLPLVPSD